MALLDINAIKRSHSIPAVMAKAGIKLEKVGQEFRARCPFHSEKSPSFTVFDGGRRFHCFGCGAHGDVLDLAMHLHGGGLREVAQSLGAASLPSTLVEQPAPVDKRESIANAKAIWRAAVAVKGTVAEAYLRWRRITIPIPDSIRFAMLCYGKSGRKHPCLIAAIASADDKLIGIQRTYLAPDGRGKANVPKPKLSLGRVSGGAIRIAPCARSMVICEGLEDGLTLQQELGRAVWVAAGATNLSRMQFPRGVETVAIGGDGDEPGRVAARSAADAFIARGIRARTFFPIEAKDFNAELMGKIR